MIQKHSNSVTYTREEIDMLLTYLPKTFTPTLDSIHFPGRRFLRSINSRLNLTIRSRQIVNYLTKYFQCNPIDPLIREKYWLNSDIPYFLWDVRHYFSNDEDVMRLLKTPNIRNVINI